LSIAALKQQKMRLRMALLIEKNEGLFLLRQISISRPSGTFDVSVQFLYQYLAPMALS